MAKEITPPEVDPQVEEVQPEVEQTVEEALAEKTAAGHDNEVAEPANDPVLGADREGDDDHLEQAKADALQNAQ